MRRPAAIDRKSGAGNRCPARPAQKDGQRADLLNGGDKNWAENPYRALGARALASAGEDFALGTAGAGTGADPADATPVTHNVTAFAGASLTENITVAVPTGALTIVLDDGADGNVDLGTAQMNAGGDLLTASGQMDVVKVTDTRAGDPG